jgi:hypothetical protein
VIAVKTPFTRSKTERPRGPLLQLDSDNWFVLCRIVRRLGSRYASIGGVVGEILT